MFRTELTIEQAARQLSRTARVLTLGSCFADGIGRRLAENKVTTLVNPFGTVFQPLALGKLLRAAAGEDVDWQQHMVEARGRWQSYDLHGSIGANSPVELLQSIAEQVYNVGTFLRNADVVLLTLGTAWAYRLRETGELVNNCQKMAAELFEKELLTPDEVINTLAETHAYLRRINPKLRFVLTVSPVRHLKDTLPLNAVSKSVLRVACHYLSELLPDVAYFPAYELLLDDLRDYRFYADDMLHPSAVAEDYVWEKFARTFFDADFGRFRKEWAGVRQALVHRPLYEAGAEHRAFLESTAERLARLSGQGVDVQAELADVQVRLAALPVLVLSVMEQETADEDDAEERIDIGVEAGASQTVTERPAAATRRLPQPSAETTAVAAPEMAEAPANPAANRPERLSPEEFRQQRANRERGGRNDRRKGRHNEQKFSPAEELAALESGVPAALAPMFAPMVPVVTPLPVAAEASLAAVSPMAAMLEAGTEAGDTTKKKKRRSRGGAKRTARKHAALLAEANELDLPAAAGVSNERPIRPAAVPVAGAASAPAVPAEIPLATEGTGPRQSSVITKSVPVKRGGRNQRSKLWATPEGVGGTDAAVVAAVPPTPEPMAVPPVAREQRPPVPALPVAAKTAVPSLAETVLGLKSKPKVNWDEAGRTAPAPVRAPAAIPATVVPTPAAPAAALAPATPAPTAKTQPARNAKKAKPAPMDATIASAVAAAAPAAAAPAAAAPVVAVAPVPTAVPAPVALPVAGPSAAGTPAGKAAPKQALAKKPNVSPKPKAAQAPATPATPPLTAAPVVKKAAKAKPAATIAPKKQPASKTPAPLATLVAALSGAAKAKTAPTPAKTKPAVAVAKPAVPAAKPAAPATKPVAATKAQPTTRPAPAAAKLDLSPPKSPPKKPAPKPKKA